MFAHQKVVMWKKKRVVKCRVELDGAVFCWTGNFWYDEAITQVLTMPVAHAVHELTMEQPEYAAEIILNTVKKTSRVMRGGRRFVYGIAEKEKGPQDFIEHTAVNGRKRGRHEDANTQHLVGVVGPSGLQRRATAGSPGGRYQLS